MTKSMIEAMLGAPCGLSVHVRPDLIIVNDGPSSAAIEGVETVAYPDRVLVYYDHDVPAGTSETSVVFERIWGFAQRVGASFVQSQGISYQHLLNTSVKRGQIIVAGGEHAGIFGACGALGVNLGVDALRKALKSGECELIVPETVRYAIIGSLPEGVSIMDAAMVWLSRNDAQGKAVEFVCPTLSQKEKAVLCSMACLRGAFTALCTDNGECDVTLDLGSVEPMVMLPCDLREHQCKAQILPLSAYSGTRLQAGQIGGYTGGTIEDLRLAADTIKGKKLAYGFRLSICPATSGDYLKAAQEGLLKTFILYGAQIHAVGDRSIVSQGPGTVDETESLLTTGLYTYDGCMGMRGAKVYCASVQSVMQASVTGTI